MLLIWYVSAFKKCKNSLNSKFRAYKCVKIADFVLLEVSWLISRKIWVIEKSWNFHTVLRMPKWKFKAICCLYWDGRRRITITINIWYLEGAVIEITHKRWLILFPWVQLNGTFITLPFFDVRCFKRFIDTTSSRK